MNQYEYAYAVGRIRANENTLMSSSQLQTVISAPTLEDAVRRITDSGYEVTDGDWKKALLKRENDAYKLIYEILPDKKMLDSIIIKNDFANLKVSLKALVCGKSTDGLFTSPSVYDAEEIKKCVFERKNDSLPECLRDADEAAYKILTQTGGAQLADSVIDKAAMEQMLLLSKKADNDVIRSVVEAFVATSNVKAVYRMIKAKKDESFMKRAVAECKSFDKDEIIKAAQKGEDAFLEFVSHTSLSSLVASLKSDTRLFEKACDEYILSAAKANKNDTFGIAPIIAFYYAIKYEVLNLNIILSAKHNGLKEDEIRGRVRELYV